MKNIKALHAFTLAEMMISMAASMLVIGALLSGSMGLQRSLHTSETYAGVQADQRRLIDYISRDLRRSIAIAATDAFGLPEVVAGEPLAVADRASLILTMPGYYQSDVPSSAGFDEALPVITSDGTVSYGTMAGPAPGLVVTYRKVFLAEEGCICFVREEAAGRQIIVRQADDLYARVTIAPDGVSGTIEVWFRSPYSGVRPLVSTYDQVMLRNRRTDRVE